MNSRQEKHKGKYHFRDTNSEIEYLPTLSQAKKSSVKNPWDFGNKVLYDLCSNNFTHKKDEIIIAKVWLIGRAYSAAIERRKNKDEINDDFYIRKVAPAFRKSKIDKYLRELKSIKLLTPSNLNKVLAAHKYLMKTVQKITKLDKRSFCSKYLHFHLPELFFIYDNRVVSAMRQYVKKVPKELNSYTKQKVLDSQYAKYVCKCMYLKGKIEFNYKKSLTIRQFDNLLIEVANKNIS